MKHMKLKRAVGLALAAVMAGTSLNIVWAEDFESVSEAVSKAVSEAEAEEIISGTALETLLPEGADTEVSEEEVGLQTSVTEETKADLDFDTSFAVTAGDWQATVYGDVGNNTVINGDSFKIEATSDNSVDMAVSNNRGRISATSEGLAFYYQRLSANEDFTLSATATVNSYDKNNQVGFGLRMADNIIDFGKTAYNDGLAQADYGSSIMVGGFRLESGALDGIGYYRTDDGTKVDASNTATAGVSFPNDAAKLVGSGETLKAGDTVDLKMKYNAAAGIVTLTQNSKSVTLTIAELGAEQEKTVSFSDDIYVGLMVARNCSVSFTDIELFTDNVKFKSIEVTTPPSQTEYYLGEEFNPEGMVVTATYDDGSQEVIDDYIAVLDTSAAGETAVTIVKGDCSASYPVTVRKINVTAIELEYEPIINRYYEYQSFTAEGIEGTVYFENGTSEEISAENIVYTVDGSIIDKTKYWRASEAGSKRVSVSYKDTDTYSSNGVAAEYDIKIMGVSLIGLQVKSKPYKTEYFTGEKLKTDGLVITGLYSNGADYYYDVLSSDTYIVSGFSTYTAGTYYMTIKLNANPSISCSCQYEVVTKETVGAEITRYPRTTYEWGTEIDEVYDTICGGMVVSKVLNDGGREALSLENGDYSVDISAIPTRVFNSGQFVFDSGVYPVKVVFADERFSELEFNVTIKDSESYKWRTAVFGATSRNSKYRLDNTDENNLAELAYLESINGSGKVTNSGHDGIVYYFTKADADNNFTISGDIEVVSFPKDGTNKSRYGQEAFGIMARDVVPLTPAEGYSEDSPSYENLGTNIVVKTENAMVDSEGMVVPNNTGTGFYSNVIIAGGFATSSYPSTFLTASYIERANNNRIKMWIRQGVGSWNGTGVSKLKNIEYLLYDGSEFDDYMTTEEQLASGECFYPKSGDKYRITLTRLNGGYYEECTILKVGEGNAEYADRVVGKTFATSYSWEAEGLEEDPLTIQNSDTIYAGFFAARWASINVTNIEFYESSKETDYNTTETHETYESAGLEIESNDYTTSPDYTLMLKAKNTSGGMAVIKLNDEVIDTGLAVSGKTVTVPLTLKENSENELTICYTPSVLDNLTSYEPIIYRQNIYCFTNSEIEGDTIYVAPDEGKGECYNREGVYGRLDGKGTIDSPLTLDAALNLVDFGQKIIMLDGIYLRDETINISSTNYGLKDAYKCLYAETPRAEAASTPEEDGVVIDMQRTKEGLSVESDYWWVKGLTIRNSGLNTRGGGVSGSYNIIEDCAFEDSGSTGFQISGSAGDSFDLWPSNNLVVNCESFNSASASAGSADGFGCKLTVGNGNMFKGCVSHNNDDDGWDLYTKTSLGPIGAVILEDCVSYDCSFYLITENNAGGANMNEARQTAIFNTLNPKMYGVGEEVIVQSGAASGNGFKLGGESVYVKHYIKDSLAFGNRAKGFDSNSNPALKVRNCVAYNNGIFKKAVDEGGYEWTKSNSPGAASNYGLYSDVTDKIYNYDIDGAVSIAAQTYDNIATYSSYTDGTNEAQIPIESKSNYLVKDKNAASSMVWGTDRNGKSIIGLAGYNSEGEIITPESFVSLNESDAVNELGFISQNADGTYNLNGFCQLKSDYEYKYDEADIPEYSETYVKYFGGSQTEPVVKRMLGDVNNDKSVDSTDATLILLHAANLTSLDAEAFEAADVNADGRANSADATQILLYAAGLGSLG